MKNKESTFFRSVIHATDSAFTIERNMVKNELTRVVYFASLAINHYQSLNELAVMAKQYDLDLFAMQKELGVNDE